MRVNYYQFWIWKKGAFIYGRYRTRLIHTIFDCFHYNTKVICWPEVRKLKNRARHQNMAKLWLDTCWECHLRHGHLRHISSIFHVICMGKLKSDKQRAKHVCPVLEMVNNNIKGLKLKKISLEIWETHLKIRHLQTDHPLRATIHKTCVTKNTENLVGRYFILQTTIVYYDRFEYIDRIAEWHLRGNSLFKTRIIEFSSFTTVNC